MTTSPRLESPATAGLLGLPMERDGRRRLLLFDIDGTLILDDGAAREAFGLALERVYGFDEPLERWDFSGRTDPQITWMVLEESGYERAEIERGLEAVWAIYLEELASRVGPRRVRLLDGVGELLERLSRRNDVVLGLLTGNLEQGARLKLSSHDLNRHFPFGAFGSDSSRREELPPIAVERARLRDGHRFERSDVVIIGDSIFDVRCGVPHGATTIAVATGRTPAEILRAENPTHLFDSLEPTEDLLEALCGSNHGASKIPAGG